MLSSTHLSKIPMNSCCCFSDDKPGFDGQSIFSTVATHTPRNSRATGGGPERPLGGAAAQFSRIETAIAKKTKHRNITTPSCSGESRRTGLVMQAPEILHTTSLDP